MAEVVFWLAVLFLVYVYFGYPLTVIVIARFWARPIRKEDITPSVSVIISAHNEERHIEKKLENTLSFDYPWEKMELILASDGSNDRTEEIVMRYADRGVKLLLSAQRVGKTEIQNRGARLANGEILFFSDATTIHPPEVLRKLVRSFADPEVGCATGQVSFRDLDRNLTGQGLKTRLGYEHYFRSKLSEIRSMLGVTGCIFAMRKDLYEPLRSDLVSDLAAPFKVLERGLRTVYEPEAHALVDRSTVVGGEFARRSRVVLQGLRALLHFKHLADPLRYGPFVSSMFIHRLSRWLAPIAFLTLMVSNLCLLAQPAYRILLLLQAVLYASAILGLLLERRGWGKSALSVPFYFFLTNAAALAGLIKCLRGETGRVWEQVGR